MTPKNGFELERLKEQTHPLLFIIMDGVAYYRGEKDGYPGNAFDLAQTPNLDRLLQESAISTTLKAHGTAVGLPTEDDMGNSEVGHNAMGAGRIFDQGAKRVNKAIESGQVYEGSVWQDYIGSPDNPGLALVPGLNGDRAVHFMGLLSDGNVHSHIKHLFAMVEQCYRVGVKKLYIHVLFDGRDVNEVSAHTYVEQLEEKLRELDSTEHFYAIASGGGRMKITMDRYEADWNMVAEGWKTHVKGEGRMFGSALEALKQLREENPGIIDQDLPPFVISSGKAPIGPIRDDDVVIFFNFRGDRAIEMSRAFTEEDFDKFVRDPNVKVHYAGMMEYDGDLKLPPRYLVEPPLIEGTVSEYLSHNDIAQFAISETQKYGHVTYFWNGNNSQKFNQEREEWQEIPSDRLPFEQKPRMKADQVADALIGALESHKYQFLRVNFANGDMVGHTGVLKAAVEAMEAVDENLGRLVAKAEGLGYTVIITADHGNCDQMIEIDKKTGEAKRHEDGSYVAQTSHTLNSVPFLLTGKGSEEWQLNPEFGPDYEPGLTNLAATVMTLLGFEPPAEYRSSLVAAK